MAFARLLFPAEARLAMEVADAHSTSVYTGISASRSRGSSGNLREVDLNETPSAQARRMQMRLQALLKTGIIYITSVRTFIFCDSVSNKIVHDPNWPSRFFKEK